jgi:hypothetical protein
VKVEGASDEKYPNISPILLIPTQRQIPISVLISLAKFYKTSTDYILGLTDNDIP